MTALRVGLFLLLLLSAHAVTAQNSELPSATDVALLFMQNGMKERHQGNMEAALDLYYQALTIDPDNANVLYELCISYFQLGDYEKSLEFGEKGAAVDSELRGQFYAVMGNCYDNQGEEKKAITAYRKGIDVDPKAPMIRYNLALTYANMGKLAEAEVTIKDELLVNPEHPSSHTLLAALYAARGEHIPAVLATLRFLVLESDGPRAVEAVQRVEQLLLQGIVGPHGNRNRIGTIDSLFDGEKSNEGNFNTMALMVGPLVEEQLNDSSKYWKVQKLTSIMLDVIANDANRGKGFATDYYVPYFAAIQNAGKTDIFIRTVMMSHDDPALQAWLSEVENMRAVQEFIEWSRGFVWKSE